MIIIYPLCCIHSFLSVLAFRSSPKTKTHVSEHSCRLQGCECAHASLHKSSISSLSSLPPSPNPPPSLTRPASLGPLPLKTTRFFVAGLVRAGPGRRAECCVTWRRLISAQSEGAAAEHFCPARMINCLSFFLSFFTVILHNPAPPTPPTPWQGNASRSGRGRLPGDKDIQQRRSFHQGHHLH